MPEFRSRIRRLRASGQWSRAMRSSSAQSMAALVFRPKTRSISCASSVRGGKRMSDERALFLPIRDIADRLRSGELTSAGLLELLLTRIEQSDAEVKAYTHVRAGDARREAARADEELRSGRVRGVLHGVPVSVKDLIDVEDVPTTYGSPIFQDHVPARDALVIARL